MRIRTVAAIAACSILCAAFVQAKPNASLRAGDPSISGNDHLLSDSDFRALLIVARQRLAEYPYRPAVYNVFVISQRKVKVLFRDEDGSEKGRSLLLERAKAGWRVTDEQALAERVTF